jgi:excisionase family DNA binding protein
VGPHRSYALEVFVGADERPRGEAQSRRWVKGAMPETPAENEVMILPKVCEYLRVHSSTVYRLLHAGKLPGYKVGRTRRFNKAQIDQFVKQATERQ